MQDRKKFIYFVESSDVPMLNLFHPFAERGGVAVKSYPFFCFKNKRFYFCYGFIN